MKFSIIVPVYNVEKYLPRCLDSVLDQEFDDYEIIAVDDESPDNSIDILNAVSYTHPEPTRLSL